MGLIIAVNVGNIDWGLVNRNVLLNMWNIKQPKGWWGKGNPFVVKLFLYCCFVEMVVAHVWIVIACPGLRPRRTLRTVLWSAEEQGGVGAQQYFQLHKVPFYPGASCWLFTVHLTCTLSPLSSCHTVHPIALKLNSGPGSQFHCFVSLFPSNQGLI